MRFLKFTTKPWSLLGLALFGAVLFTGCKDDDDDEIVETPVEDGFYIQGDASAFSSPSLNGVLKIGRVENLNGSYNDGSLDENQRPSLLTGYVALTAGGTFNVVQIAGSTTTSWGSVGTIEDVDGSTDSEYPNVIAQRGDIGSGAGSSAFSVDTDGLYLVVIDTELEKFMIAPASTWAIIGGGIGGWSDQEVVTADFNTSSMTWVFDGDNDMGFTSTGSSPYKYRVQGGWKLPLDETTDFTAANGETHTGLNINTNAGCNGANFSCDGNGELIGGGGDIEIASSAINRYTLTWTAGEGFSASVEFLDDVPAVDYSSTALGLIGDGLADHAEGWGGDFMVSTPMQNGTAYEWTFSDVNLSSAGGFKIRTEDDWDTINIGFSGATISGDAAGEMVDSGGNFAVTTDGIYDLTFIIDGDDRTLIVQYD